MKLICCYLAHIYTLQPALDFTSANEPQDLAIL